ncbi:hypothetical protein pipiens_007338 [Culex pipiens pipiens]|uniref:Uncharacterized protein n=1 Tax=Culex pipiens pipiens TaxID=38569 RepID=A0ABD1DLC5_CULPP
MWGFYLMAFHITEAKSKLFNEINTMCCDSLFKMFTLKDAVVRLSEVYKSYQFLDFCYKKLKGCCVASSAEDGAAVLLRGETDNLKLKADYLSSWDLSYLKFCCKAHGIRRQLYACQTIAVVSLTDIKRCYPLGTVFEDHFPNKTMYSQLAVKPISQTRPQGNPSPKNVNPSPKQAVCNSADEALAVRSHACQVLQPANTTTMTYNDQQESGQGPSNRAVSVIMFVQSPINPPLQESWLHSVIPLQEQVTSPSHSQSF